MNRVPGKPNGWTHSTLAGHPAWEAALRAPIGGPKQKAPVINKISLKTKLRLRIKMFFYRILGWLGLILIGCHSGASATSSSPVASSQTVVIEENGGDVCSRACLSLRANCPGTLPTCESVCRHLADAGLIKFNAQCIANAINKTDVVACGQSCL